MKNTENLYAIAEIIRAFTPLALTAAGGAIAIYVITSTNLSADKFAIASGIAGAALTGACGAYNPQAKERNQPQARVGHIDQVDIEQIEQVAPVAEEDAGKGQSRSGGEM